ncbi:MAG: DUF2118 domain-containing protein, partial [Pseudomonadota bacterium]
RITGRLTGHASQPGSDWVVGIAGQTHAVTATRQVTGHVVTAEGRELSLTSKGQDPTQPQVLIHGQGAVMVRFADGQEMLVEGDWTPGDRLTRAVIDGQEMVVKVDRLTEGFRIRHRGADLDVTVRTPRAADLAAMMPVKAAADTSRLLLCPMPGVVVSLAVSEGEDVQEGQALATVEAMKMENVLRAERACTVAKICCAAGDSLAVDDVIMEFS